MKSRMAVRRPGALGDKNGNHRAASSRETEPTVIIAPLQSSLTSSVVARDSLLPGRTGGRDHWQQCSLVNHATTVKACVVGRRYVYVALVLAFACGGRTGLGVIVYQDDATTPSSDAGGRDVGHDARPHRRCPFTKPTMLYQGDFGHSRIALDATNIFWCDLGTEIRTTSKLGGPASTFVGKRLGPWSLATSNGDLYWSEVTPPIISHVGSEADAAVPVVVATNQHNTWSIAVAGDEVYWFSLDGFVAHAAKGGPPQVIATQASDREATIIVSAGDVFWTRFTELDVMRYSPASQNLTVFAHAATGAPTSLVSDGVNVYFNETYVAANNFNSVPVGGGAPTLLAKIPTTCPPESVCNSHLATDGDFLYFTTTDGFVRKIPVDGGEPTVIADHQAQPEFIEVDDACVYWQAYSQIWAAPK